MRQEFENPPINELVIGVYFKPPLLRLRSEHVGAFWQKVRADYPKIEQQNPLGIPSDAPNEIFPMPRYWLVAGNNALLVQVQRNALLVNWRRVGGTYPHFDSVKAEFDKTFANFSDFVRAEDIAERPSISTCELTYINLIQKDEHWSGPEDISKVVPSFSLLSPGVKGAKIEGVNYSCVFRVDTDMALSVTVRSARRLEDKAETLVFEQRVSGDLDDGTKSAADDWFKRAHNVTNTCFNHMTDKHMQRNVWKPRKKS